MPYYQKVEPNEEDKKLNFKLTELQTKCLLSEIFIKRLIELHFKIDLTNLEKQEFNQLLLDIYKTNQQQANDYNSILSYLIKGEGEFEQKALWLIVDLNHYVDLHEKYISEKDLSEDFKTWLETAGKEV